ncbi:hypothetical protein [Pseudoduganella chitinolytica]|uniref:Uncharacterized protein n=1 Tax=Pseudoduganella chitinolytica TaxID=34070 RepID=A0ABY8BCC3_9BURK|nr:hypothetical protein [Pseudoduganella chitinolytica]WEF33555.1 hypothetical protein PX653_01825 [Pseudoduganella chitinolytica]
MERKPLQALFHLGDVLEWLALCADEQAKSWLGCLCCDQSSSFCSCARNFAQHCESICTAQMTDLIMQIDAYVDALPEAAARYAEDAFFERYEWAQIRSLARQLLRQLDWEVIQSSRHHLQMLE